jgi:hypothetical protein
MPYSIVVPAGLGSKPVSSMFTSQST